MHDKIFFLQRCVSLNYLSQQELSSLLKEYGKFLPDNIGNLLLERKFLTTQQLETVKKGLSFDQIINEDIPFSETKPQTANEDILLSKIKDQTINEDVPFSEIKPQTANEDILLSEIKDQTINEDTYLSKIKSQTANEDIFLSEIKDQTINEDVPFLEIKNQIINEDTPLSDVKDSLIIGTGEMPENVDDINIEPYENKGSEIIDFANESQMEPMNITISDDANIKVMHVSNDTSAMDMTVSEDEMKVEVINVQSQKVVPIKSKETKKYKNSHPDELPLETNISNDRNNSIEILKVKPQSNVKTEKYVRSSFNELDSVIYSEAIDLDLEEEPQEYFSKVTTDIKFPTPGSAEDISVAQKAVEQKKISVSDLQQCVQERNKRSQSGNNISICELLIKKNALSIEEVESLRREKKTEPAAPISQTSDFLPDQILADKFRIVKKLGSGGMGAVYKVQHTMMINKYFALKIMHPYIAANENNYKRFVREVEATMSIMHPNIIAIREFGRLENNSPYLTMDCSPGIPLDSIIQENWTHDISRSLEITCQILDGLGEAHNKKIIHRDLKPANILVEANEQKKDFIKIVDFGLAKLVEESEIESITQGAIGTPFYMSPQQAGGEKVDHRTDIYAVGVILYEMVTGKLPFKSNTLRELLKKQIFELPNPPIDIRPDLPKALNSIILKSLSKEVEHRYQTTNEFIEDIERFKGGEKVKATTTTKRKTSKGVLVATVFALLIVAGGYLYHQQQKEKQANRIAKKTNKIDKRNETNKIIKYVTNDANININNRFNLFKNKVDAYLKQKLWSEARASLANTAGWKLTVPQNEEIKKYRSLITKRFQEQSDYQTMNINVGFSCNQKQFDKAIALLKAYRITHPKSIYDQNISLQLKDISQDKKRHTELTYQEIKNEVISLKSQNLWQAAYKEFGMWQKISSPNKKEKHERKKIKLEILRYLGEKKEYEKIKNRSSIYIQRKKYKDAGKLWNEYINNYPKGEYGDLAREQLVYLKERALVNKNNKEQELIKIAKKALQQKKYKTAEKFLLQIIKKQPKNKDLLLSLGKAYFYQQNYKKAFKPLIFGNDGREETLYQISKIYQKKGSNKKAADYLIKALEKSKRSERKKNLVLYSIALGKIYQKVKKTKKALKIYKKALLEIGKKRTQKKHVDLFRQVGMMLFQTGNKKESKHYLKTYQDLGGKDSQVNKILLQFIDYTPLSFKKSWKYRTRVKENISYYTYRIVAIQNNRYMMEINGRKGDEYWFKKNGYFIKEFARNGIKDKVFKFPAKTGSSWQSKNTRKTTNYKIISTSETIRVPAGKFTNCVKIESSDSRSKTYIYYAPEVGEVKLEKEINGSILFSRELIEYNN